MPALDPAKRLARELDDLRREVRSQTRGSQATFRSFQVDGQTVTVPEVHRVGMAAAATATDAAAAASSAQAAADLAASRATTALTAANGKNKVTFSVNDPDTDGVADGDVWFKRDTDGNLVGTWRWNATGTSWDPHVFADEVLGSLTVAKLVTGEIAAGQKIIAGPANGTHAEMASTGFRVFAADPVDGIPNEVIRLGTNTNDFFGITDGGDTLLASIDQTGRASLRALSVTTDPVLMGRPLVGDILQSRGKGLVAWAVGVPDQPGIIAETPLMGINFIAEANRIFLLTVTGIRFANSAAGGGATFIVRDASTGNGELGRREITNNGLWNEGNSLSILLRAPLSPGLHTITLSVAAIGNAVHAQFSNVQPYTMTIEDVGPMFGATGQTYAVPTPTPVMQAYSETIPASWAQAFKGDGSFMSNSAGRLYQGQDPSGVNGNQKSLIGFPDLTSKLAGATIQKIEVFLYASYWNNNAGGTAVLGTHGLTSVPATFTGSITPNRLQSTDWPKPGGRVVDLTAWGAEFQNGTARGVVLGPGPSTDLAYYGYFNGVGQTYSPELRISYTK